MADEKPIIVLKKKGGHGGHHGGAWKVAYADFVTAMMCFFMVMWLVNSADSQARKNIASYFRRPGIFERGSGTPLLMGESGIISEGQPAYKKKSKKFKSTATELATKRDEKGSDEGELPKGQLEGDEDLKGYGGVNHPIEGEPSKDKDKVPEQIQQAAEELRSQIASSPELQELLGIVDVQVGTDGLHIEIMDTEKTSMFGLGSARVAPEAEAAFQKIAGIMAKLPNTIDIVGHTDAKPFRGGFRGGYSNWELSADRANAARRLLEKGGVPAERIKSVLGRADRDPRIPSDPMAAANRRITLTLKFPVEKKIDVSNDLSQLEHLPTPPPAPVRTRSAGSHGAAAEPSPAINGKDKIHSFTPKEILKQGAVNRQATVTLPEEAAPRVTNPPYMEKDKIFKDNPVLGPAGPFDQR